MGLRLNFSSSSSERSLLGRLGTTAFLLVFGCSGLFFLCIMIFSVFKDLSSYSWIPVEATILESSLAPGTESGKEDEYVFNIRFSYEWDDKPLESSVSGSSYDGSSKVSALQRLVLRYPPGSKHKALVDPVNPAATALFQTFNWFILPFLTIPLLFIFIGFGGIYSVWCYPGFQTRFKDKKGLGAGIAGFLFFSAFFGAGLLVSFQMSLPVLTKLPNISSWKETPCTILHSSLKTNHGSKSTTYSAQVVYKYTVNGQIYLSSDKELVEVSSSEYSSHKAIAEAYKPGEITRCYVNPKDPCEALLDKSLDWSLLFCLFPLPFLAIGGGGLGYLLYRFFRKANQNRSLSDDDSGLDAESEPVSRPEDFIPALKKKTRRITNVFIMLGVALFWNGIVSVFVSEIVRGWNRGQPDWFLSIFMIPFVLIGLFLIGCFFVAILYCFNPRYGLELHAARGSLKSGGNMKLYWESEGASRRIRRLRVILECTINTGKSTLSLEKIQLFETDESWKIDSGSVEFSIPEKDYGYKWDDLEWKIRLEGKISFWPGLADEYVLKPEKESC